MDTTTRCTRCGKRMIAVMTASLRTELQCIWCSAVDPLKTDAVKWASSSLAPPE